MKKLLSVLSVACGALLLSGCGGDPTAKEEVQEGDKDDSSMPLLISCEACGKEVSKAGEACFNCSHPIAKSVAVYKQAQHEAQRETRRHAEEMEAKRKRREAWVLASKDVLVPLVRDVDPAEMPKIVEVIKRNPSYYELDPAGTTVSVPKEDASKLRMALASKGMPSTGQVCFEIFDEGGFGISDFVQRTNYVRALQGELARTISSLDEVKSVRVMVVLPQNELILSEDPNDRPSASVFVNTGGNILDKKTVNAIQFLVANSVKGVSRERVSVMDNQGNTLSEGPTAPKSID